MNEGVNRELMALIDDAVNFKLKMCKDAADTDPDIKLLNALKTRLTGGSDSHGTAKVYATLGLLAPCQDAAKGGVKIEKTVADCFKSAGYDAVNAFQETGWKAVVQNIKKVMHSP